MKIAPQQITIPLRSSRELVDANLLPARTRKTGDVKAQWYAGSRWTNDRAFIWQPVQDAKKDLNRFTRWELNKAAEKLWKDSFLIRGVIKRLVTLIIGSGAYPTPKSSSKEFNDELKIFLRAKFRRPCIDNKKSFANYQRKLMRGVLLSGESFTVKVTDPLDNSDKLQGFEWSRCSASGGKPAEKKDSLVRNGNDSFTATASEKTGGGDGIEFYDTGYPKAYRFVGMDTPVDQNLVVHHALIDRHEQVRGETILAAVLNTSRDVDEILALEKMAVKDASSHQDIIQTMSGDYDPEVFQKSFISDTPGTNFPTPPPDDQQKIGYYNSKLGGSAVLLKTGDKYTPYVPNRPGNAWEGFMAFLANGIVLSTGLPPSLVLPIDIGGTDIRRDLQIGQKLVEIFQSEFADDLQEIAEFFIQGGIEDRVFKSKIPADWNNLQWHFTGSLTVDRNKDQVRMMLVEAGLMTRNEYHGENAEDGEEQMQQVVREVKKTRFLITGIAESEPFASAVEFKQFLNLSETSSLTFREMDAGGEGDAAAGGETPAQKQKRQQQNREPIPA